MSGKISNFIDEELNSTEIGQFIARNKVLVVGLVVAAIAGVAGWGVTSYQMEKKHKKLAQVIYAFEKDTYKSLEDKKIEGKQFVEKYQELLKETGSYDGTFALGIQSADLLMERSEFGIAKDVLEKTHNQLEGSNPFVEWFLYSRLAVVHEDLNDLEGAIGYLKKMNSSSVKLLEPKIYLDLGRLYLKMGKKDDALVNLKYVVDHFSDSNFAKMAKLYLNDIK